MAFSEGVAANIRAELGRQGISYRELGRRLGKPISYVSTRLGMNQKPVPFRVDELEQIAEVLGVPVGRLLGSDQPSAGAA